MSYLFCGMQRQSKNEVSVLNSCAQAEFLKYKNFVFLNSVHV